jgi:hypothetical protein
LAARGYQGAETARRTPGCWPVPTRRMRRAASPASTRSLSVVNVLACDIGAQIEMHGRTTSPFDFHGSSDRTTYRLLAPRQVVAAATNRAWQWRAVVADLAAKARGHQSVGPFERQRHDGGPGPRASRYSWSFRSPSGQVSPSQPGARRPGLAGGSRRNGEDHGIGAGAIPRVGGFNGIAGSQLFLRAAVRSAGRTPRNESGD